MNGPVTDVATRTELARAGVALARINWGRPVVDCPKCPSALTLEPGTPVFGCWDCGAGADIVWPANWADVVLVLALRPDPNTRNWEPGESVMDLVQENLEHGILPNADELESHRGPLLVVVDDRIVSGIRSLGAA